MSFGDVSFMGVAVRGLFSIVAAIALLAAGAPAQAEPSTAIIDRFANREIREREALRQMEAWRANAISRAQALRANAVALREPPSLTVFGEQGAALRAALETSRQDLPILIDQMIANLEALAAFGIEAIRSPTKVAEVRQRAIFSSSVQLIRIDSRRISASVAALAPDHPNRSILNATLAYYRALEALPAHQLRLLDGGEADPMSVAATLRQSSREMRALLAQTLADTERMAREIASTPFPPEGRDLQQALRQMMQTYPDSVRAYNLVADTLDRAAAHIEGGGEVLDAWVTQEQAALPIFDQISRLEDQRAQMAASLRR